MRDIMRRIGAHPRVRGGERRARGARRGHPATGPDRDCRRNRLDRLRTQREDRAARAGGWGQRAGRRGSGYSIGRRALRAVARGADGRGPATSPEPRVVQPLRGREARRSDRRGLRPADIVTTRSAQIARLVQQARERATRSPPRVGRARAGPSRPLRRREALDAWRSSPARARGRRLHRGALAGRGAEEAPARHGPAQPGEAVGRSRPHGRRRAWALAEANGGARLPSYCTPMFALVPGGRPATAARGRVGTRRPF